MGDNRDDPFAPQDGTIIRPRPGAGRRTPEGTASSMPPASPPPAPSGAVPGFSQPPGGATQALADFVGAGGNPILQAAAPLLMLAAKLQTGVQQANIGTLRQQAVHEIRALEERLGKAGVTSDDALITRYVLCTFVDSAVSNTPWGHQGGWSGQSLLVMFHKEVSGGEKFFQILDRVRGNPARYADLIELLYVCLALGYEGKYRQDPGGPARLAELQHDLYRLIRDRRQLRDEPLSPSWQGVQDKRNPVIRYVPWWIVGAAVLAALAVAYFTYQTKLRAQAEPVKTALAGQVPPVEYPAPAPPRASRLKDLLQPEEAAGKITVEDFGDKTVVTLTAPNLFRSGSANVDPAQYETLRAVGLAIEQVPGRVLIVGHTDDQPVRSFKFADNFELSRERALSVAKSMKPVVSDFGRLEWQGVGSTQPRYKPVDTPENRARNRRVEIVHTASTVTSP
jgi:type VI secretion system protein ImpK